MKYFRFVYVVFLVSVLPACAGNGVVESRDDASPQYVDVRIVDGSVNRTAFAREANPDEIICKRERVLGSRFNRTVCKTRRQIDAARRAAEYDLSRIRAQNASHFMRN